MLTETAFTGAHTPHGPDYYTHTPQGPDYYTHMPHEAFGFAHKVLDGIGCQTEGCYQTASRVTFAASCRAVPVLAPSVVSRCRFLSPTFQIYASEINNYYY